MTGPAVKYSPGMDWNALYGVGSPAYKQEQDASWAHVAELYNNYSNLMAGRNGTQGSNTQVPTQQAVPASAQWTDEDLVGAGIFWGIPEDQARAMPREALIAHVNQMRQGARADGGQAMSSMYAPLAMLGVNPGQQRMAGMAAIGAGEAITGTLQKLPVLGDWFAKGGIVHSADMALRQMEEGVRASSPESLQPWLSGANVAGNLAAMWYPGTAAWAVAGKLGKVVPLAARLSPIGRAAVQGGIASYLLEGGTRDDDPNPWAHRAKVVAGGAAFGAGMKMVEPLASALANRVTNAFVSKPLLEPGDLGGVGAPTEAAARGNFEQNPLAQRSPADLAELAMQGDTQAQEMLNFMQGGQGAPPAPPVGGGGSPAATDFGTAIQHQPDFSPQVGNRPEINPLAGAQGQMRGPGDYAPRAGLAPEMSPFAPAEGGSPAGTPFQDWTPQTGLMRGPSVGPVAGLRPERNPLAGLGEVQHAEALATQMNKAATIVQSAGFPEIAGQAQLTDRSVAVAAAMENPGGTNLVQGIADPTEFTQHLGPNMRFAQRNGRLDLMMSDEPLADVQVEQYTKHGIFEGQKVLTRDGVGGKIAAIDEGGNALVAPIYSGSPIVAHASELHPWVSSPASTEAPNLWSAFESFSNSKAAEAQEAMGGSLSPTQTLTVRHQNQAIWMDQFFDQVGISNPGDRARIGQYFNERWVDGFKGLAPAETVAQQVASAHANGVLAESVQPVVQSLDRHAASKGFVVIPENENAWHVQDIAPQSEVTASMGPTKVTFGSREAAETWIKSVNRELPDITPASDVPLEVMSTHLTEPTQQPNINEGVAPRTSASIAEMAADSEGGGDFPPTEALVASGNTGRLNNRWVQSFLRWRPARRLMSALDQGLIEHTGQDIGVARDWNTMSQRLVQHHNDQNPWMDELTDIIRPIRTKFLNDGSWTRVYEILDPAQRAAAASRLGFNAKELASFDQFEGLMQKLFPETGLEEIRQIPRYISHIAQRQSQPELVGRAFEDFPLSASTQPFYEHVREGSLNFRELHPGTLGETYIRAVTWKKNMAPLWDAMSEKYNGLAQHEDDAVKQVAQIMSQQLKVVKNGYQATDDTALDMLHGALQAVMGSEVTRPMARELFNFGLNSAHAGMLGFRPSVVARDILQVFLAFPRAGKDVLNVYGRWMTDPAARKSIWEEAVREGEVSLQMPRSSSPGAFAGELEAVGSLPEGGVTPGASDYGWRMKGAAKITGAIRDMLPEWLRDTRDTPFNAMYLYGKQSELTRALVYTAGKEKALRALATFRAAGESGSMEQLMGESAARTFDPSWQREFQRLVGAGSDDAAARFLGHQLADATQFKYGTAESPWIAKSLTGRVAMQFGNYPMQYFQFLRESMSNGTIGDKAKLALLAGATFEGLRQASAATGWNFRWMNPFAGLGFTGGPLLSSAVGVAQGVQAMMSAPGTDNPNYSAMQAGMGAAGNMAMQMFPFAGLVKTAQGLGAATESPDPGAAVMRHLITGQVGPSPDITNMLQPQAMQHLMNTLQPYQSPMRAGAMGLPPGTVPPLPVSDPQGLGVAPGAIRP